MVIDAPKQGQGTPTAVLCSGGLDSAVLVAHEARAGVVQPVYVSGGLAWEASERESLPRLLEAPPFDRAVRPLAQLDCPIADTYPATHWALSGAVPSYNTPDSDVYLVGRNVLLLAKVSTYCAIHRITRIAVGPLAGNPFPDATPDFFAAMKRALSIGLAHEIRIVAPFAALHKRDVIVLGASLGVPFAFTLSCLNPTSGDKTTRAAHCGRCSKCRERLQAFEAAGLEDPAQYAFRPNDTATGV